ncbi:MAG: hypothetical protein RR048_03510 [Oscillospiraceae bacterium]
MKKIAICLLCLLLFTACSPREKAQLDENGFEISNPNSSDRETDNKNNDEPEEPKDENDEDKDEEEVENFDGTCYKIENSGFEMTINENWMAIDIAEPMGAMLLRGGDMANSANIVYATGELKKQIESDLESVFDGLKADKEINDYKITRSDVDGYYRILLTYNQINEDNSYTFSYVIYQQTQDGLLNIAFQMSDQYPNEIKDIIASIRPETKSAKDMPKEQ